VHRASAARCTRQHERRLSHRSRHEALCDTESKIGFVLGILGALIGRPSVLAGVGELLVREL
jgi:hypothetical protein